MNRVLLFCTCLCFSFTSFTSFSQIVNIPDANFKNLLLSFIPPIDTNGDGEIQVSEAEAQDFSINIDNSANVSDLTGLEAFINLKRFTSLGNTFETVNFSTMTLLEDIIIQDSSLTEIDLSNNNNLEILTISGSEINEINIQNLVNLEELNVSLSNISEINVSQNLNLIKLYISQTNLTEIDVSDLTMLADLDISNNTISAIDISNNSELQQLYFLNTEITSIDISNNMQLLLVDFSHTNLTLIDLSNNVNLQAVGAIGSSIEELDLSNNSSIQYLETTGSFDLKKMNIKNISLQELTLLSTDCPQLNFICVDNVAEAIAQNFEVPPYTTFVTDCSLADGELNRIEGVVNYDSNGNDCGTGAEGLNNYLVNATDGVSNFANSTNTAGEYGITVSENTYTTQILGLPPYFDTNPATATNTFVGFDLTQTADFCVVPNTTATDLTVSIIPITEARPGFEAFYEIIYENVGTTTLTGEVTLDFSDVQIDFVASTPSPTNETSSSLTFNVGSLAPFAQGSILATFLLEQPPVNESGQLLAFTATINPTSGDATPEDNTFYFPQVIVNSFDPNDKTCVQGHQILIEDADNYLHYIVRFQNLGTASAINVRVVDVLDELLDFSTFRVLTASHDMETTLIDGQIDFIFDDIFLPAEIDDPEGSNGFVTFKIKPLPGIVLGDEINNRADIYFDFNPPVLTNTTSTTYVDELGVNDTVLSDVVLFPNPATNTINIQTAFNIDAVSIVNTLGQNVQIFNISADKKQLDISSLATGMYFVKVTTEQGTGVYQILKK